MNKGAKVKVVFVMFLLFGGTTAGRSDDLVPKKGLTLAVAKQLVAAAEQEACKKKCGGAIAVLDDGGNLVYFEKFETNNQADGELALKKARSSFVYRTPTKNFQDRLEKGEMRVLVLPDAMPNPGGMPLMIDKTLVGAIGVGGVSDDQGVAQAAVDAFKKLTGQPVERSTNQTK
jgi:glc operon protein GlcG